MKDRQLSDPRTLGHNAEHIGQTQVKLTRLYLPHVCRLHRALPHLSNLLNVYLCSWFREVKTAGTQWRVSLMGINLSPHLCVRARVSWVVNCIYKPMQAAVIFLQPCAVCIWRRLIMCCIEPASTHSVFNHWDKYTAKPTFLSVKNNLTQK